MKVFLNLALFLLLAWNVSGVWGDGLPWWKDAKGPAYQVLVYSFADSDGDGWGDLNGITEHLDYLNDGKGDSGNSLNVSALWLSPVFPADSYHGYDADDFYSIDKRWGSLADFDRLVAEAHKRGLKIVMDIAFNHTGRGHPWFKEFSDKPNGPRGNWYVKKDPAVTYGTNGQGQFYPLYDADGNEVDYFSAFWQGMPDLNAANPEVNAEFRKILKFWLARGVDGFRFDAAKHIFDPNEVPAGSAALQMNKKFWNSLRADLKAVKPDVYLVGEVLSWSVPELAAYSGSFDSLFDFAGSRKFYETLGGGGVNGLDDLVKSEVSQFSRYPDFTVSNLLNNHDEDRILTQILARTGYDDQEALRRTKAFAAISQTLPGLPWVYYGEELGMVGGRYMNDDVARRDAFPWSDKRDQKPNTTWAQATGKVDPDLNADTAPESAQEKDPKSLLSFYKRLSVLRASSEAIRTGAYVSLEWPGFSSSTLYAYERKTAGQTVLVVHNLGKADQSLDLPGKISARLFWDSDRGLVKDSPVGSKVTIKASQSAVWIVKD